MRFYLWIPWLAWSLVGCGSESETDAATHEAGIDAHADAQVDAAVDAREDAVEDAVTDSSIDGAETGDSSDVAPDIEKDTQNVDATNDVLEAGLPTGCLVGDYQPYFGNLHAHTSYSDGKGLPSEAFAHARQQAGLDVQVITDHLEQLYWPNPSGRWDKCRQQADDAYEPGAFVALCGFEYGSGFHGIKSTGHNNVFFSDKLFPMVQLDFRDFYKTLVACANCIGQFNHPGDESEQTWSGFEYHADADDRIQFFEFNGAGDVWNLYFAALDKGWHVSAVMNQDNHSADWGTKNDNRSGLWMPELTREGLRDTMLARRTFMTRDRNATLRLMAENQCWMGSVLQGVSSIDVFVEAKDADAGEGYATLELYGPGKTLLGKKDCQAASVCTMEQSISAVAYVLARATQVDGDELLSAPIWLEP
ncbi:MAG TPA: DUF3604 domain-containing protein [Polyangiaceae bacterium]|nr:DUF3604 domain-containing protein [Polyangiaceae bacterium]